MPPRSAEIISGNHELRNGELLKQIEQVLQIVRTLVDTTNESERVVLLDHLTDDIYVLTHIVEGATARDELIGNQSTDHRSIYQLLRTLQVTDQEKTLIETLIIALPQRRQVQQQIDNVNTRIQSALAQAASQPDDAQDRFQVRRFLARLPDLHY